MNELNQLKEKTYVRRIEIEELFICRFEHNSR